MWFASQQLFYHATADSAKNSIDIFQYTIKEHPDDECSFIIEPLDKKRETYFLKSKTKSEALEWVKALRESKLKKVPKGKVFGHSISKLELSPTENVPIVLVNLITYLSKYGSKTQGIFRLSGSLDRINELRERIDKDEPVPFKENDTDVHCAAALLKALFRELPEPILSFSLYEPLLQAKNVQTIKECLSSLPEINKRVMKYLCDFLSLVNSHSSINQMENANLSICFGPNLLRPKESSLLSGLMDTPQILFVVRTLLANYTDCLKDL